MWRDDRINMEVLYPSSLEKPLRDDNYEEYDHVTYKKRKWISFLDWYEGWLDNALYFAENHLKDVYVDEVFDEEFDEEPDDKD